MDVSCGRGWFAMITWEGSMKMLSCQVLLFYSIHSNGGEKGQQQNGVGQVEDGSARDDARKSKSKTAPKKTMGAAPESADVVRKLRTKTGGRDDDGGERITRAGLKSGAYESHRHAGTICDRERFC